MEAEQKDNQTEAVILAHRNIIMGWILANKNAICKAEFLAERLFMEEECCENHSVIRH